MNFLTWGECLDNNNEHLPIACAANGDEEAFAVVSERLAPLIRSIVQNFDHVGLDDDDLEQEASLGLLAAVRTFREDGGAAFTTYAATCIRNRLTSVARRQSARTQSEQPFEDDDRTADTGSDPAQKMLEREDFSRLQEQLRQRLTDLEYRVLLARLSDLPYDAIARQLGVSKKAVDNAVQRLRRKMTAQ